MLDAFAAAGAVGAVGVLPVPADAARGEYAPFFGITSPNLPAVYVDRAHGQMLAEAIAGNAFLLSHFTLDATVGLATSENLIGVLPGASDQEILIGSHTDGPNSMEDNGPAAILALASCLATSERPRTVRFVLSGGHFVASQGMASYVAAHATELTRNALAAIEIEHLGAREWNETSPGVMSLTGQPEIQLVSTWPNAPLVAAGTAFASQFPRSIVGGPPILGEGQNFRDRAARPVHHDAALPPRRALACDHRAVHRLRPRRAPGRGVPRDGTIARGGAGRRARRRPRILILSRAPRGACD